MVSGVPSHSTKNAEGLGDYGPVLFRVEQLGGMGDMESGDAVTVNIKILLEDFQTSEYFAQLLKYQDL